MSNKLYIYFLLFVTFLSVFYIDLWHNANTVSRLLPVKSFVLKNTWCIDDYQEETIDKALINGHYYSEKAPLPAWIVTPVFFLLYETGIDTLMQKDDVLYLTGSLLLAVIPFICIVMLIFQSLLRNQWNIYKAMLVTLALSFSTFAWIYAGTSFSHIMTGLWLILAYIFIKEKQRYVTSGFFAGLCFLTEYPTGLIFLIWAIVLIIQSKSLHNTILFGIGAIPSLAAQLIYNYHFTGNALDMLYHHQAIDFYHDPNTIIGFALPIPSALWELLFGFYRGWFIHAPILLLFFAFMIKQTYKTPMTMLTGFLVPVVIASYVLFSSYKVWYGGWCFGPRHFVPITLLLLYHFAKYCDLKGNRLYVFSILTSIGIIYCWMAKSTLLYSINAEYKNPFSELILPAFTQGHFNENNLLTLLFSIPPIASAITWLLLFAAAIFFLIRKSNKSVHY